MNGHLTEDCLDRWLEEFDSFKEDLLRSSYALAKAVGYYFDFDQAKLKIAHESWAAQCRVWQAEYVMPNSNGLSHLKIGAILLHKLCTIDWVKNIFEFDSASEPRSPEFDGTEEERDEIRDDIASAQHVFFGFQFVMQVLNWFENARDDRVQEFYYRMTTDLEHDLMVYLTSERREEMAIFLILKSLYVRDPKPTQLDFCQ